MTTPEDRIAEAMALQDHLNQLRCLRMDSDFFALSSGFFDDVAWGATPGPWPT